VRHPEFDALMVDLGWTLVSNPVHLTLARRRGIATIGWSKGVGQEVGRRKSAVRLGLERWLARRCDVLVVYGGISRDYFVELGFPPDRIYVAQNAVDTARIARERELAIQQRDAVRLRLGLTSNRPIVGFLGKIAPFKRVDQIVKAYELARGEGMDALLVLAGNGPGRAALEQQIAGSPWRADIHYVPGVPGSVPSPGSSSCSISIFPFPRVGWRSWKPWPTDGRWSAPPSGSPRRSCWRMRRPRF